MSKKVCMKNIFFKALKNGFFFKNKEGETVYAVPNTYDVHYYKDHQGRLSYGFTVNREKGTAFFYCDPEDYGIRWALTEEELQ